MGLSELIPEKFWADLELVTLSWEAGSVYVIFLGGKSLSVGVQVEQVSPPPWCRNVDTRAFPVQHQHVSPSCFQMPAEVLPPLLPQCRQRACLRSALHTGIVPRDLILCVTSLPKRSAVSSDMGRDRSQRGASLTQGNSAS